jgi:hypothetical protein
MFDRIIKAPDSVAGTAQLERSGMLQTFGLDQQSDAKLVIQAR